ncbi:MAG: AMP-binding protein [Acidobacteriota bacterium]|nr:AMP-binding protein [Acidobacteriota bacterium]
MIFRAPEPDVTIPDVALTPFLLERAAVHGDRVAFIDGGTGRTITFRSWAQSVRRVAAGLARRGFRKGDVFAIYSPNLPEYAELFHGVSLAGGVNTTINPTATSEELARQLRDAGAVYLATTSAFLSNALAAAAKSGVRETFVFDEDPRATPFGSLQDAEGGPPAPEIDPAVDLVALPYSSGTTGLPKGVMLTHRNLVANVLQAAATVDVRDGDVVLGVLPFFHIYGMSVIMNVALYRGAAVVTMPRFELERCLETIQRHRVSLAFVVPPIVLALAKSPLVDRYDLSSVRMLFSGAAPLGENVAGAAAARLGCGVTQGYGMTETSPVTHAGRGRDGICVSGIGPPVPNTEVRVVDLETGGDAGANEEGEIWIRGPQVMKGYLNRPDATAAMIDGDGWLHTGDVGYADEAGNFFVVDRVKELIKYKGFQVAPAELEAVLLSHPCVSDAAVIPFPDEEAGEIPKAYVVLRSEATADDLMTYVADRVARYKQVRRVEITDQIPKSPSGKILRRVLVDRERARAAQGA